MTEPDCFQSNMLLEVPNGTVEGGLARLLIDCGGDARRSLAAQGLSQRDLEAVFISHLHGDHVGGLEWLGFTTYFDSTLTRPRLFIPACLEGPLWENCLRAAMEVLDHGKGDLTDFFEVKALDPGIPFSWRGLNLSLAPTQHLRAEDGSTMTSFGLRIPGPRLKAYFTSDSRFDPVALQGHYDWADIIFQDCETTEYRSNAHTHYGDLLTLPAGLRGRMWLYHYQSGPKPDCRADGFLGWVETGQVFDL
ncbi:MAG: MBL fold metallo-hydrolase [Rhodospirillum sp.]|nr:MBL fold metallo-hydrolase [Rhodospirillum sp.]MCF8488760.1 MBL fold metallo-hydrolase [Rhodospirillum sp.]MCF8499712.1 MBL fold metallo-hydrolase [Rhodospirillum sp.]